MGLLNDSVGVDRSCNCLSHQGAVVVYTELWFSAVEFRLLFNQPTFSELGRVTKNKFLGIDGAILYIDQMPFLSPNQQHKREDEVCTERA